MAELESTIKLGILGSNDDETLSFIRKISTPFFESNTAPTIGVDFYVKILRFDTNDKHTNIKVQFWVISNNERFRVLIPIYLRSSDGFIFLLNLVGMKYYHDAKYWISIIRKEYKQSPILLIGYSMNERAVDINSIKEIVDEFNIIYMEISLKNEADIRSSIIFLSCIILHLQIPYDIQKKLELTSSLPLTPHVKEYKEILTHYKEAPTSFSYYRYNYTEFLQNISIMLNDPDLKRIEPHLELLKDYINKQETKVNSMKGRFLEMNTRLLFEREYSYVIDYTEKDFECEIDEIKFLHENNCLKSHTTKDIQIDVFGKKIGNGSSVTYLLGECKDRNKKIKLKEIKCFIIKARIIAEFYLYIHKREKKSIPNFHLLIVSLNGFPDTQKINKILEDNWHSSIPKKRILNESIDMVTKKKFVDLLRKNNISISEYKD